MVTSVYNIYQPAWAAEGMTSWNVSKPSLIQEQEYGRTKGHTVWAVGPLSAGWEPPPPAALIARPARPWVDGSLWLGTDQVDEPFPCLAVVACSCAMCTLSDWTKKLRHTLPAQRPWCFPVPFHPSSFSPLLGTER